MNVNLLVGFNILVIIFFLVMLLGIQIQITGITRRLDDIVEKDKGPT